MAYLYLLHAERPIAGTNVQNYLGYTGRESIKTRFAEHVAGRGAALTREWNRLGIRYWVARTWNRDPWTGGPVNRETEARFKKRTERWTTVPDPYTGELVKVRVRRSSLNVKRLCPECNPGNKRGLGAPPPYVREREEVVRPDDFEEDVYADIPY